jgi:hypothetical protein
MKFASFLFALFLFVQEEAPYKAKEEFEIKLNFEFRTRPLPDPNTVDMEQTHKELTRAQASGPLPYLFLNVRALTLKPGEVRVRVVKNDEKIMLTRKIDTSTVLKLELGYTDDIKDRVSPYEYTLLFQDDDKKSLSRIVVRFEEDGTYLVNGEKRGKI